VISLLSMVLSVRSRSGGLTRRSAPGQRRERASSATARKRCKPAPPCCRCRAHACRRRCGGRSERRLPETRLAEARGLAEGRLPEGGHGRGRRGSGGLSERRLPERRLPEALRCGRGCRGAEGWSGLAERPHLRGNPSPQKAISPPVLKRATAWCFHTGRTDGKQLCCRF
jgi:hypothetical protein